jgi:hypothetical protein
MRWIMIQTPQNKGVAVGHYKIQLLDLSGAVTRIMEQEYQDALDALDAAEVLSSDSAVEVWSERGRVARVTKDNKPSGPEEPIFG